MPTAIVILPPMLREKTDQQARLNAEGATIRDIIEDLEHRFPGIRFHLCYENRRATPICQHLYRTDKHPLPARVGHTRYYRSTHPRPSLGCRWLMNAYSFPLRRYEV